MKTDKQLEQITADIFREYVAGDLSKDTTEIIQGWLANEGPTSRTKMAEMERLWNSVARYEHTPSRRAYRMYGELRARLGFAENVRRPVVRLRRSVALRVAAVLLPAALIVGGYLLIDSAPVAKRYSWTELSSTHGRKVEAALPDGTTVCLYGDTRVMPEGDRAARVHGEAYFKVAHRNGEPFTVRAGDALVTVLGTEFNVAAVPGADLTEITLYDGRVRVSSPGGEHMLSPGKKLRLDNDSGSISIVDAPCRMPEWMAESMVFTQKPLSDIFTHLGRIHGMRVVADNTVPTGQLVTLKLRGNETLAETMFMLSQVSGAFTYTIAEDEVAVRGL